MTKIYKTKDNMLLYADDLVLVAETEKLLMEKLGKWKKGMETKGLEVKHWKRQFMRCQVSRGQVEDSGQFPCSVCSKGADHNSVFLCVVLKDLQSLCPVCRYMGLNLGNDGRKYA